MQGGVRNLIFVQKLKAALRTLHPGRFSEDLELKLLAHQGWYNQTFLITQPDQASQIFRTRRASDADRQAHQNGKYWSPYHKEAWAMNFVHLGVPVPKMQSDEVGYLYLDSDQPDKPMELYTYMLEEFIPCKDASTLIGKSERNNFFAQIGVVARQINSTATSGFGREFCPRTMSFKSQSWQEFLDCEISRLNPKFLEEQHFLTAGDFKKILQRIDHLKSLEFEPSLFHLDFIKNWGNILIAESGAIQSVIDWEYAGSGPATHYELASTIYIYIRDQVDPQIRQTELNFLLAGYGISPKVYQELLEQDVNSLVLLSCLEAFHKYSLARLTGNPEQIEIRKTFALRAKAAVAELLKQQLGSRSKTNPFKEILALRKAA